MPQPVHDSRECPRLLDRRALWPPRDQGPLIVGTDQPGRWNYSLWLTPPQLCTEQAASRNGRRELAQNWPTARLSLRHNAFFLLWFIALQLLFVLRPFNLVCGTVASFGIGVGIPPLAASGTLR